MYQSGLKACDACKSSKRKCTKQLPQCRRCEARGLSCLYQSRPRMIVYQADGDAGNLSRLQNTHNDQEALQYAQGSGPSTFEPIAVDPQLEFLLPLPRPSTCPSLDDLRGAWFLTPDAWKIAPIDTSNLTPISITAVHRYLDKAKDWLKDWIETKSNPFIHAELYGKSMPGCVQDAFMVLSTYLSRTDKTEELIHRLIEEKADQLVASQTSEEVPNDTLDNIGRVQSLLIYSIIRLFDGDIRQRHFAERHLPILYDWTKQMLLHASNATGNDTLLVHNALTNYTPELNTEFVTLHQVSPEQLLWHAWILSESIRRTWCLSMIIQAGYELLKTSAGPCHGGILVTTRKGVWEAETAFAWTNICAEKSVGFVHRNDTEMIMAERTMDEVDDFTLALMELDFGPEKMARWQLAT
ncbi:Fc.00g072790.m01.CDS01 [Cosmosporella sp. VM-42]